MNYATTISIPNRNSLILSAGIFCVVSLVVMYMYFLSMSVVHVVLRKEVLHSIRDVQSDIAALEATYIDAQHQVSNKMAALENFTATDNKIFVTRGSDTFVLSNNRP